MQVYLYNVVNGGCVVNKPDFIILIVSFAEPKPTERPLKKKKSLPVTDPAKTSLILFDEVDTLYMVAYYTGPLATVGYKDTNHFTR